MGEPQVSIRHDDQGHSFVAEIDGADSGAFLKYRVVDDRTLDYFSTYTPNEMRGRGLAARIVTEALDYALERQLRVVPSCPYVAKLIERNDRYRSLID